MVAARVRQILVGQPVVDLGSGGLWCCSRRRRDEFQSPGHAGFFLRDFIFAYQPPARCRELFRVSADGVQFSSGDAIGASSADDVEDCSIVLVHAANSHVIGDLFKQAGACLINLLLGLRERLLVESFAILLAGDEWGGCCLDVHRILFGIAKLGASAPCAVIN